MKNNGPKRSLFKSKNVNHSFTSNKLTNYAGLSPIVIYINRLKLIAAFTHNGLVKALLGLETGLNNDVINTRLKQPGKAGAIMLQEHLYQLSTKWLTKSKLENITLDAYSTIKSVYYNQQCAEKVCNPKKQDAKCYHPALDYISEIMLIINSWFRCGLIYTSNGIYENYYFKNRLIEFDTALQFLL